MSDMNNTGFKIRSRQFSYYLLFFVILLSLWCTAVHYGITYLLIWSGPASLMAWGWIAGQIAFTATKIITNYIYLFIFNRIWNE